MEENIVYVIVEPSDIVPIWYSRSITGLRKSAAKQKHVLQQVTLEELELKNNVHVIVVVSTNDDWTQNVIERLRRRKIRVILIGTVPQKFGEDVSGTLYSGKSSVAELLNYFNACGHHHVAIIGLNRKSSNESVKVETYLTTSQVLDMPNSYDDVYYKDADGSRTTDDFLEHIRNYDGVICSNDYIATFILHYAEENGIKVPDDLFVAGLGDIFLCRYTKPTLTSASRSYFKTGEQVYNIWKQLTKDQEIVSIITTVQCKIKPRGSTAFLPVPPQIGLHKAAARPKTDSVVERASTSIRALENCISQCDSLDMKLIKGTLEGISAEKLAEQLFISVGTARYRLSKIYNNANVESKPEFTKLFRSYILGDMIFEDIKDESN